MSKKFKIIGAIIVWTGAIVAIVLLSLKAMADDPPKKKVIEQDTVQIQKQKEVQQLNKQLIEQKIFRDSLYLKLDSLRKEKKK